MFTLHKILKTRVKVSPKFQIVIPKAIREEMKLQPGQELFMYLYEGKLHLDTASSDHASFAESRRG